MLQVGDGISHNGGLAGNVTNNDTLVFATPGTMSSSANISGSGTLTETGPGALTLAGTETCDRPHDDPILVHCFLSVPFRPATSITTAR